MITAGAPQGFDANFPGDARHEARRFQTPSVCPKVPSEAIETTSLKLSSRDDAEMLHEPRIKSECEPERRTRKMS